MEKGMTYLDYDKISDDLCWLGRSVVLRMNVKLSYKGGEMERRHFHNEYGYDSTYPDYPKLYTIRRSFSYYLSIEHTASRESVMITINDILLLRMKLAEVFNWFSDGTFVIKNKKLVVLKHKACLVDGLVAKKELMFEPIIMEDMNGVQSQGIRMTIASKDCYVDVSVNAFAGFVYIINQIDMYAAAQNIINYLGRPEFGTNLYSFEKPEYTYSAPPDNIIKERKPKETKPKKSFFDTIDDM